MHNLVAYKDYHFPRFLQILPITSVPAMMPEKNMKGEIINHKQGRITSSGYVDVVTIAAHVIKVGDQLKLPWSVVQVESIEETRAAKGEFIDKSTTWMRLKFSMVKNLVNV